MDVSQSDSSCSNPSFLQLASQSPRRAELLAQIGVPFKVVNINVEELRLPEETPEAYVSRLAKEKAETGFGASPQTPTLGSDTIVVWNGNVLEKPRDEAHAVEMLMSLSGSEHHVYTAVAIADSEQTVTRLSRTKVCFREISRDEARAYWHTGEPADKAGGYGIQGLGAAFVKSIEGSYSGVVGLPIESVVPLLKEFNLPYWCVEGE